MPTITFAGDTVLDFVANEKVPAYNATVQNDTDQTITITVTNDDIQGASPTFATPDQGAVVITAGSFATITDQYEGWRLTAGAAATGTVDIVESGYGGAGGGAGDGTLTLLDDVNITAPADKEVLTYDSGAGEWVNQDTATNLSGATLTSATVAGTDKVIIQDTDDSDNIKTVTAQSIADLLSAVLIADTSTSGWGFVLDEDNMASDSATKLATQQSIKAYVDSQAGGGLGYTAYFGGSWGTGGNTDFARVSTVAGGSVDGTAAEENNFVVPATGTITKITWSKQNTGGTYTMKINYGASNTTFNCTSGATTGVNTVSLSVTEGDIITIQQNGTASSIGDAGFCLYIT